MFLVRYVNQMNELPGVADFYRYCGQQLGVSMQALSRRFGTLRHNRYIINGELNPNFPTKPESALSLIVLRRLFRATRSRRPVSRDTFLEHLQQENIHLEAPEDFLSTAVESGFVRRDSVDAKEAAFIPTPVLDRHLAYLRKIGES